MEKQELLCTYENNRGLAGGLAGGLDQPTTVVARLHLNQYLFHIIGWAQPTAASDVGIVVIDGNKIYMTRQELKDYIINLSKKKIELLDTKTLNLFRSVANGIYQAEGHTGISFNNLNDLKFWFVPLKSNCYPPRPIWFISQNASKESIQFFILLKNILSQKGVNLNYSISVIDSGHWHIKLISRSLEDIVLKIFPYFNLVRAKKWNTFIYLEKLFYIRNSLDYKREIVLLFISPNMNSWFNEVIPRLVLLGITALNQERDLPRAKPISEKLKNLKLDTNSSIMDDSLLKIKISREYSLAFLWGFFLGDGNFYIRVRLDQGFYFVPVFRISQIENSWNYQFLQDLKIYLNKVNISVSIKTNQKRVILQIEGEKNIRLLLKYINSNLQSFVFWKKDQFFLMNIIIKFFNLDCTYILSAQLYILECIYSTYKKENKRTLNNLKQICISKSKNNIRYVSRAKNSWIVTLPKTWNILPKQKYFTDINYDTTEKAFKAAILYRDEKIKIILNLLQN